MSSTQCRSAIWETSKSDLHPGFVRRVDSVQAAITARAALEAGCRIDGFYADDPPVIGKNLLSIARILDTAIGENSMNFANFFVEHKPL